MLEWNHCWIWAAMSTSTQQLRKTCTTHTNPGLDYFLPICHSAFHCKVNQYRTNIPFIPKAQRGPLQNQVAVFQRYKIYFKKSLSLPHGNHLLSSIITRPHTYDQVFWRLHLSFNFLLSKDNSVHFFAQIRIATFWAITVCCYFRICVNVHAARFGDVGNSFPGFAWVLLRCIWDIVRQNRNQMNIDAQQNTTAKTCALRSALTESQCQSLQNVTKKSNIFTILQDLFQMKRAWIL